MICPNCGTQISNSATFCVKCGANVKAEASMEETVGTVGGSENYDAYTANTNGNQGTMGGYVPGGYGVSHVSGPAGKPPVRKQRSYICFDCSNCPSHGSDSRLCYDTCVKRWGFWRR